MRKLKLDVEALSVETFRPEESFPASGTVVANDDSVDTCACPLPPPTGKTECTCPNSVCVTCGGTHGCWPSSCTGCEAGCCL